MNSGLVTMLAASGDPLESGEPVRPGQRQGRAHDDHVVPADQLEQPSGHGLHVSVDSGPRGPVGVFTQMTNATPAGARLGEASDAPEERPDRLPLDRRTAAREIGDAVAMSATVTRCPISVRLTAVTRPTDPPR